MNQIIKDTLKAQEIINKLPKSIVEAHNIELNIPDDKDGIDPLPPGINIHLEQGVGSFIGLPLPKRYDETDKVAKFTDGETYTITFWKKFPTQWHLTIYRV